MFWICYFFGLYGKRFFPDPICLVTFSFLYFWVPFFGQRCLWTCIILILWVVYDNCFFAAVTFGLMYRISAGSRFRVRMDEKTISRRRDNQKSLRTSFRNMSEVWSELLAVAAPRNHSRFNRVIEPQIIFNFIKFLQFPCCPTLGQWPFGVYCWGHLWRARCMTSVCLLQ